MRHSRTLPALGLLLALSPSAWAGPPPKTSPPVTTTTAATDRARALHVEGAKLYEEGKYEQAYVAFVAAWSLKQHPAIAGNLADCEVKLGKHRDAAEHYRFVVRNASGEAKPDDIRRAEERLRDVRKEIGALKIEAPIDRVDVFVDGKLIGQTPLAEEVFVEPGDRKVEARHPREGSEMRLVKAEKGSAVTVRLTVGVHAPEASVRPPSGSVAPPPAKRSIVPGVVLGSVAVAGLAGGIGLLVAGGAKRSTATELNGKIVGAQHSCVTGAANYDAQCSALRDTTVTSDRLHDAGIGMLIGAGVVAAGAGVYLLWPTPKPSKATTVRLIPAGTANAGGLWATGTF